MKCPVCSNTLRQVKSKSAIVDVCSKCRGIWFDSGELADFVKLLSQNEKISPEEFKLFHRRNVQTLFKIKEKDKFCPKCGKKLQKFNYSYDSNIFLDRCIDCGGIWADGGEVIAIASYLKENPAATAVGEGLADATASPDLESEDSLVSYFLFAPRFVVPISDDIPRERFPFVTISLIVLCMLAFLGQVFLVTDVKSFIGNFGLVPAHFLSIGLITSMFLHAGVFHLIFNMLFLWLFGDNVEDRFSRPGYLIFCLSCGLLAGTLHCVFNRGSTTPVIGASGMVSGIMGAYLLFYPSANVTVFCLYRTIEVPAVFYLGGWFVIQLTSAFMSRSGDVSRIAWCAHIGGFIFGMVVAYFKKLQNNLEQNIN
jgi:membrane associated rhomboid family serine protease/Zn-finger nucleic acid-binding protein